MYYHYGTVAPATAVIKEYMGDQMEKNYQFQAPVTLLSEIRT